MVESLDEERAIAERISTGGLSSAGYLEAISVYFAKRDWSAVRGATSRALEEHPRCAALLALEGDVLAARGEWDTADKVWQSAIALADHPSVIAVRRVWGAFRAGSLTLAEALLREARHGYIEQGGLSVAEALVRAGVSDWQAAGRMMARHPYDLIDPVASYALLLINLGLETPDVVLRRKRDHGRVVAIWCPEARAQAMAAFCDALRSGGPVHVQTVTELKTFPVVALRAAQFLTDPPAKFALLDDALKANPCHRGLLIAMAASDPENAALTLGMKLLGAKTPSEVVDSVNAQTGHSLSSSFINRLCSRQPGRELELMALGGAEEVGASAYALTMCGRTILLDCGLDPKHRGPNAYPDLDQWMGNIDAVVISHGHLDHCGALPKVHHRWPAVKAYCTDATRRYASILLHDMINVQQARRRVITHARETYSDDLPPDSVEKALRTTAVIPYGEWVTLFDDCRLRLHRAGHILGAAIVEIEWCGARVVYTGDFCLHDQGVVKGAALELVDPRCDLLITEATYAGRQDQERWDQQLQQMLSASEAIIERGGSLLLPSFAIGRSQELAFKFRELILGGCFRDDTTLWIAGLAASACEAAELAWRCSGEGLPLYLTAPPAYRPRRDEIPPPGTIVIASSGMLIPGSASARYAEVLSEDPANGIFFPGYLDEESEGVRSLRRVSYGATTGRYSLSAHAGPRDIEQVVRRLQPNAVAVVHWGAAGASRKQSFAATMKAVLGGDLLVSLPKRNDTVRPCDPSDWLWRRS